MGCNARHHVQGVPLEGPQIDTLSFQISRDSDRDITRVTHGCLDGFEHAVQDFVIPPFRSPTDRWSLRGEAKPFQLSDNSNHSYAFYFQIFPAPRAPSI